MWSLLFVLVRGKGLVVGKGVQLKLKAGDTVDARRVSCGILVKAGGKLLVEGSKTKPVVFLGGAGVVIHSEGKLEIHHAIFACDQKKRLTSFQQLQGTAIRVGNGTANISSIEFSNWKRVISLEGVPARGYQSITANRFLQNETAIEVNTNSTTPLNLDLSCNVFEPGTRLDPNEVSPPAYARTLTSNSYGVRVVPGSVLGRIGKYDNAVIGQFTFAANVWPTTEILRTNIPAGGIETWGSPLGWTSISNSILGSIYYKYKNEYLGASSSNIDLNVASVRPSNAISAGQSLPPGANPLDYEQVCDGVTFPADPFPLQSPSGSNSSSGRLGQFGKSYLLQNVPNPASHETIIGYHTEGTYNSAKLEVIEIGTGKSVEIIKITPTMPKAIVLSLRKFKPGVFAYKLVIDGEQIDIKKLTVQP